VSTQGKDANPGRHLAMKHPFPVPPKHNILLALDLTQNKS